MEHIIIEELENGYKLLKAEEGYKLYNTVTQKFYSEAIVLEVKDYIAIED